MSRRLWRCRNPECGEVLGRITDGFGLELSGIVIGLAAYMDTGRVDIKCPNCGLVRSFWGHFVRTHDLPR